MITYKLINSLQDGRLCAIARSDGWQIPIDENSQDYQVYLKWLEAGNVPYGTDTPLPADEENT